MFTCSGSKILMNKQINIRHSTKSVVEEAKPKPTGDFFAKKRYFTSPLPFFFILLLYSFFEKFFNVFTCAKQNNGENILQTSESLVSMT